MKKSAKLLSILLAILMIFSSVSVLASAHVTQYKTTAQLEELKAYSPNGEVTRLKTEDRISILMDSVDELLSTTNIYIPNLLQQLIGMDLGIVITIDLTSIDGLCTTIDSIKPVLNNAIIKGALKGSALEGFNLNDWTTGKTRENTADVHTKIIQELTLCLGNNAERIEAVLNKGIVLSGLVGSIANGSLTSINETIKNLPKMIKGMVFPLLQRVDDTREAADAMQAAIPGDGNFQKILDGALKGLLTKSQKFSTYKEDANYNCISNHVLPDAKSNTRVQYTLVNGKTENAYYTVKTYDPATKTYVQQLDEKGSPVQYKRVAEKDAEGKLTGNYIYAVLKADGTVESAINYHTKDDVWVPSFAADILQNPNAYNLDTATLADLFYRAIPFVFKDLAPVVLNGSVKKLLAEWFGAGFKYIADVDDNATLTKVLGANYNVGSTNDAIFTKAHQHYTFDWSDYAVLKNGMHVWRFKDQIWKADLSNCNPFFNIFNWGYQIDGTFFDEFLPANQASRTTLFQSLNDFVYKFMQKVLTTDTLSKFTWKQGGNENILENAKAAARGIISVSPESIFGANYASDAYYQTIMTGKINNVAIDDQTLVCVIAAEILKFAMPQLILPAVEQLQGQKVGAMFAYIIREVTTQLLPNNNYDELIFASDADYNTRTIRKDKDNSYWLDVCLTMGMDIGMHYLPELCDMGDDSNLGYKKLFPEGKAWTLAEFEKNPQAWEAKLDWLIDYALTTDQLWTWNAAHLVNCGEKVDLATTQDPWKKLDTIFAKLGLFDQLANASASTGKTWLENALRDKLVLGLLDLDITRLIGDDKGANGLFNIPEKSMVKTKGFYPMLVEFVRNLVNNLFHELADDQGAQNDELLDSKLFTSIDSVMKQSNIAALAKSLLQKLAHATNQNGLLDFAAPILNNVIGWKVTRQELSEPSMKIINSAGKNYAYTGANATNALRIYNASSGMLQKHQDTKYPYDTAYAMKITAVESKLNVALATNTEGAAVKYPYTLQPGTGLEIKYEPTPAMNNKTDVIKVTYTVQLKDGSWSKPQTDIFYTFISADATDLNQPKTEILQKYTDGFITKTTHEVDLLYNANPVATVASLAGALGNTTLAIFNKDAEKVVTPSGKKDQISRSILYGGFKGNVNSNTTYFENAYATNGDLVEAVFGSQTDYYPGIAASSKAVVSPFKMKANAPVENVASGKKIKLATIAVSANLDGQSKNVTPKEAVYGYMHILPNISRLEGLYKTGLRFREANFSNTQDWNAFQALMETVTGQLLKPMMSADFDDIAGTTNTSMYDQAKVDKLADELETAIKKLEENAVVGNIQDLYNASEAAKDFNYQDYELYEYFKFDNERQWNNKMLAAYAAPEKPDRFIKGSNKSEAEIKAIAEKAATPQLKNAILATLQEVTPEMNDAYDAALAAYQEPSYTDLQLLDATSKIKYYQHFMTTDAAKQANNAFLQKEIASANAQNYVEANYSKDSWARYTKALATAQAALTSSKQSEMFNAKYELQLAQNKLVPAEMSAKDNGYYAPLNDLIAQADAVFANPTLFEAKNGGDTAAVLAELIEALGYEYGAEGAYANLYANSAKMFVANDRVIGDRTDAEIAAHMKALKDVLAKLECKVKFDKNDATAGNQTQVNANEFIINGINPASILDEAAFDKFVKTVAPAGVTVDRVLTSAKAGYFGTGTKAVLKVNDSALATYTLVIYGDVNGDGAVDAFDAALLDRATADATVLKGANALAGDVAGDDGKFTAEDYAAIITAAKGGTAINQVR